METICAILLIIFMLSASAALVTVSISQIIEIKKEKKKN